ncbi:MAG: DUF2924 domain-containing protein [Pseudomonadota bacterium]
MTASLEALGDADRPLLLKALSETIDIDPPTSISQDMMRLIIGWQIQASDSPGTVRPLVRQMDQHFAAKDLASEKKASHRQLQPHAQLSPGTQLIREWRGEAYCVEVLEKGFVYEGQHYGSLSPIAKVITGSHRSGPQFFGTVREGKALRGLYAQVV